MNYKGLQLIYIKWSRFIEKVAAADTRMQRGTLATSLFKEEI